MSVSRETDQAPSPMTGEEFFRAAYVSHETYERLALFRDLLEKWQKSINLIGPATVGDIWRRHFLDSAQIYPRLPCGEIIDLGSGAGFPGLVLAIMHMGDPKRAESRFHLLESDQRKGAFLREVIRQTNAPAQLHSKRIEEVEPLEAAAITARALAPLPKLLTLAEPFLQKKTELFFLKGQKGEEELTKTDKKWTMRVERIKSVSDPSGVIFHLKEVSRG